MSLETNAVLFLMASLALIATPGPDMIYVITRSIARAAVAFSVWSRAGLLIVEECRRGHSGRDVRSDGGRRLAVLALLVAVLIWSTSRPARRRSTST
jgi:hypothetical protein